MYKMMCKQFPFPAPIPELYSQILNEEVQIPAYLSENAKALLSGLLKKNPNER
jgi:serine/threonine protein kinase